MATVYPWFMAFDHMPAAKSATALNAALGDQGIYGVSGTGLGVVAVDGRNRAAALIGSQVQLPSSSGFAVQVWGVKLQCGVYTLSAGDQNLFVWGGVAIINERTADTTFSVYVGGVSRGTFTMTRQTDYYLEVAIKPHASAGWVVVRLDGVEVFRYEGAISAGTYTVLGAAESGGATADANYTKYNDCYIKEGVDDIEAPGFYGPILMRRILLSGDILTGWTRNSGATNYEAVNTFDSDTTYISTSVIDTEDQYEVADLPAGVNSVIAVVVGTVAEAPDGGAPLIAHTVEVSSTKEVGADRSLGSSAYRTQQTVFLEAPDSTPWSEAKVNGIRVGLVAS